MTRRSVNWRRLTDQRGFIDPFTISVLGWLAITSIASTTIFGTSSIVGAMQDKPILHESAEVLRGQADIYEQKGYTQTAAHYRDMADKTDTQAALEVWKNVSQTAYDAVLSAVPFSKLTNVGKVVKFGWDFMSGAQLGQAARVALDECTKPPPDIARLQEKAFAVAVDKMGTQAIDNMVSQMAKEESARLDAYILDAKVKAAQRAIEEEVPNTEMTGASSSEYKALTWDLAKTAVLDMETKVAEAAAAAGAATAELSLPEIGDDPWTKSLATELTRVDPSNEPTVTAGKVMLDPEDNAAMKAGELVAAIGQYVAENGQLVPVVVRRDDAGNLKTEFPLIKDAPEVDTSSGLKPDVDQIPSWWDGSRASCPFLYADDGAGMALVNDLFSVSRDPKREYVDNMLFAAKPGADGTLALRVSEVRAEESFIDRMSLSAVDVPDGYDAALSPGGHAFSVRDAQPAQTVSGGHKAALAADDGRGVRGYEGVAVIAEFAAPGPGAVLLLTADGFQRDGSTGHFLAKRPALRVAAFADGRWTPVGEAHPRELTDTTAFNVARFVRGERVKVRVTCTSCDTSVYQLIDRLALSSAPSGLARVHPLQAAVTGPSPRAAALLAARDGRREHLVPGQSLTFRLPDPGADAYIITSVAWYREVSGDRK